jgi:hypothetical protein
MINAPSLVKGHEFPRGRKAGRLTSSRSLDSEYAEGAWLRRASRHTVSIVKGFVDNRAKVCNYLEIKLFSRSWRFLAEKRWRAYVRLS